MLEVSVTVQAQSITDIKSNQLYLLWCTTTRVLGH